MSEAAARRVLLVRAHETAETPLWTAEDRVWATRLARETVPAGAAPARFLDERASHALQRLAPRDPAIARWLGRRLWRWTWLLAALAIGLLAGLAVDAVGSAQRIDLLAPPVWGVILWNLVVYIALLWPRRPQGGGGIAGWLARRLAGAAVRGSGPLAAFTADWLPRVLPALTARGALLLHAAAAALAAGLVAGMYLRGLVLDYRAGWESTFLEPASVRALLATLLAPATALTGIGVPDEATVSALRVGPGVAAGAPAGPWIHLYAAMLALFVIVPRTALATWAALRGAWASRRVALPLEDPYFQQLLLQGRGAAPRVRVLPHGAAPSPQAVLGLRELLAGALGAEMQLRLAAATAYGAEESAGTPSAEPDTTLLVALVDLAATPEADTHGRFLRALRAATPALPLLLLADEAAFARRFGQLPERLAQRREAWRQLAAAEGAAWLSADLERPDADAAARFAHALQAAPAAR
ncbi:MAG: DUF2868 domain-containing protein [Rubrivivax sp.]|nr:DUF2868 domain-containing protein [Rubrivivax sp.]